MDLERLPDDVGFVPNLNINAENLPFKDFWNPSCVHRPVLVYTYVCMPT